LPLKSDPENRALAIKWLSRVGAGELIERSIHYQSLNGFLRERLEAGRPVNPLISDVTLRYLSVTNGRT
jgi:hypothetical protein